VKDHDSPLLADLKISTCGFVKRFGTPDATINEELPFNTRVTPDPKSSFPCGFEALKVVLYK
jgi:hypothetical protein